LSQAKEVQRGIQITVNNPSTEAFIRPVPQRHFLEASAVVTSFGSISGIDLKDSFTFVFQEEEKKT
jgi:hypothetical protein